MYARYAFLLALVMNMDMDMMNSRMRNGVPIEVLGAIVALK